MDGEGYYHVTSRDEKDGNNVVGDSLRPLSEKVRYWHAGKPTPAPSPASMISRNTVNVVKYGIPRLRHCRNLDFTFEVGLMGMSWLFKNRSLKERDPKKRARNKHLYKNQDKHRWRNLLAWFIPFLAASVIVVIVTHGDTRFWVAVVSSILLLAYAWVLLERYICRSKPQQRKLRVGLGMASLLLLGGAIWQRPQKPTPDAQRRPWLRLTDEERRRFVTVLAQQTAPRERVRIGCPAANEEICVLVTPFVDAFKRGHFIVENNRVDRITLGQAAAGVVLFKYGHADAYNPQDPDQGVWVRQTPSMETIEEAFAEIGINLSNRQMRRYPKT